MRAGRLFREKCVHALLSQTMSVSVVTNLKMAVEQEIVMDRRSVDIMRFDRS
jgi:hypothetical protein